MSKLKGFISFSAFVISAQVYAQSPQDMNEEQMQQMMQGMSQIANCFQSLDQSKLESLANEAKAKQDEFKQLCANGERDKAQQEAMAFGMKYVNSDEFSQLKKCGEMAQGMMPANIPDYSVYAAENSDELKNRHVCDDL